MSGTRRLAAVIVLAIFLFAGYPDRASGAEWVYFATTAKGTHYYDPQSVKKTNVTVSVQEKTVYSEDGKRVAGSPAGGTPWRDLAPGTLHERLSQRVCQ